jgi:glycosyltransferase involved in cell wall biosynthesis
MDGGSTDGSVEIIERFADRLTSWTSEKDAGQADAIARGFAKCRGEILAYINSDDTYLPGAFRAVAEAFAAHPEADLIYGDSVYIDARGRPLAIDVLPAYRRADLLLHCIIPQQAAFWRRRAYDDAGGIDPSFQFALDYDLFLRIAERGRLVHVPRLLAAFRQHGEAKTTRRRERWVEEDRKLQLRHRGRAEWSAGDWLRMKWLTARQIGAIGWRSMKGERFPCLTPVRWKRLSGRKIDL